MLIVSSSIKCTVSPLQELIKCCLAREYCETQYALLDGCLVNFEMQLVVYI